jgi:hypothetical protein
MTGTDRRALDEQSPHQPLIVAAYYLDWTSTRIATATIATAMNIQYWIRTPKMAKPSTRTCMAIAPFAGRDFHSMFIASKELAPDLRHVCGDRFPVPA